ncbi:C4-dicarboxylate transporter/malic acid transport protein [Lentithecium fluviatile CBS 122367]|uniref:C4-dicarboxylate transporter/malic acid transport protein n=1 Tax=Lentithecium fluviatile CBS 122367 TaxID=1168545 RepID=A0A6G1JL91_9PLEO|nr:C4-dicarboxylate transporter/malic acid transport protein [Lentithecium fluviatile CBS 122367]
MRVRLKHFTWAWFTSTMSTGGLAIALARTPHRFGGLQTIGAIVFIFNLALFLILCMCMTARASLHFAHFKRSFINPQESFFFSSFLLSICIILCDIQLYGLTYGPCGPWLITTLRVLYWIYAAVSLINAIFQYFVFMIDKLDRRPVPFNLSWFLTGYSAMLTGTVASIIAESQPPEHRISILVSGCAYQGFGFLFSMVLVMLHIMQLMEKGLPPAAVRAGLFIPVGTPAYTIIAFIGQARAIPTSYGYFAAHPASTEILLTMVLFISIALWILTFWLFAIAVLGCIWAFRRPGKMSFALPWWAFIFPNVGFTVATVDIGMELGNEGILWVGSAMTIGLVAIWVVTVGMCVRAVVMGKIVWPGRDEDKNM